MCQKILSTDDYEVYEPPGHVEVKVKPFKHTTDDMKNPQHIKKILNITQVRNKMMNQVTGSSSTLKNQASFINCGELDQMEDYRRFSLHNPEWELLDHECDTSPSSI